MFNIALILTILLGFILFFGGYFAGIKSEKDAEVKEIPDPEPIVVPPLDWEGNCPKTTGECPVSYKKNPPLILVSLDGFHPDFMDRGFSPTIKSIAKCGSHAPFMFPVFPSKTFPNHYSQVTGLNPPSHGIIDNNMYDPIKRKVFKVGQPESLEDYWWLKEPIWVTAQKQGKKSGCYFWAGSEVKINGTYPTYYKKYNYKISFNARVDQILRWLDLPPDSRPQFLTLYVNLPDHALHAYGTKARQVNEALQKVDGMVSRLFAGLQERDLLNCANVIIMSDHGMSDINCKKVIDVSNVINASDTFSTMGPFGRIRPKGKRDPTIVTDMVSKLRCKSPHMRAYEKEQLPVRMHYADNSRIEPIFLDLDAGWTVVSKGVKPGDDGICSGGAHGYDNMFPDMRAIFVAHGPAFKRNFTMRPFINTEIYEMLTELLEITPNPNNGTRGSMHYMMTSPHRLTQKTSYKLPSVADIPSDESVYNDRVSASRCSCPQPEKQATVQDITATQNLHLPFGTPHINEDPNTVELLYNEDYITAYSSKYKMALWSSFIIKEQSDYHKDDLCWMADARISTDNAHKCDEFELLLQSNPNVFQRPLYPFGFSSSSSLQNFFITNSILKSLNHSKIIEEPFNQMLKKWASESGDLNVVMGPAYDYFATGIKPSDDDFRKRFEKSNSLPVSTHIFAVVTWCDVKSNSLQSCEHSKLESHAFLLPNQPYPLNCQSPADMILKNAARVVDVEKLTGISFFTDLSIYDAIRLRTAMPMRGLKVQSL